MRRSSRRRASPTKRGFTFSESASITRLDIPLSSPAVVMAAIAARTKRIRLTSAVTILSTLDPVRVFQDFATLDILSAGRAEIIAGRGAFTESFPLFGHDIADYDTLFAEKLDLLCALNEHETSTWSGRFRAPLKDAPIAPRPTAAKLPIWLGVGGTPESAQRAGNLGLPLTLANIFQPPAKFVGQIADYRERHAKGGHDPRTCRVALATHCHVAKDSQAALDGFYPYYAGTSARTRLGPASSGRRRATCTKPARARRARSWSAARSRSSTS